MIVGFKITDVFVRIVQTYDEFVAAITQVYPASPLDLSALTKETDLFYQYLARLIQ